MFASLCYNSFHKSHHTPPKKNKQTNFERRIIIKYCWFCQFLLKNIWGYNQTGDISTLDGTSLKLVDKFTYLGSSVSSTEKDDTRLTKAWTAIDRLLIIWKSKLTDKMKRSFFQAAVASILLYRCTTWTLTKWLEKKLDGNYTRMLWAILNKSWQQHPTIRPPASHHENYPS